MKTTSTAPLTSTEEVAGFLGLPVATLYAWRLRSEGPKGYRVGRHLRFRLTDVEAWLETQADRPRRSLGAGSAA